MKIKMKWYQIISIIGLSLFIGICVGSTWQRSASYEKGYFYGWHESGFIDCTLPTIEKEMRVVLYNDTHMTYDKILKWEDLCAKFTFD